MLRVSKYFVESLKVIENGTIRKVGYGLLSAFNSNNARIFSRFDTIHERDRHTDRQTDRQTPCDGIGRAYTQHRAANRDFCPYTWCMGSACAQ